MKPLAIVNEIASLQQAVTTQPEAEWGLKVAVIYQHDWNRRRAGEICQRIEQVAGKAAVGCEFWSLASLDDFALFAQASWSAAGADVIIVAIDATEELPPQFQAWIDVWLPRRCQVTGAFVASLNVLEESAPSSRRTISYLQAVARQGGLDFLLEERYEPMAALPLAPRQLQRLNAA